LNVTFAFFLLACILLLFKFYNLVLQKLGRLTGMFKFVYTNDIEPKLICDQDWEVVLDVDEELG